jgi:hypothetical protein
MKRWFALCLAALLLAAAVPVCFAASGDLPFEVTVPTNTAVMWLEEGDSPTTMRFSYTISNDMAKFYRELEEAAYNGTEEAFLAGYDWYAIWTFVQIDWAIDDVNDAVSGWHYSTYWDRHGDVSVGYDEDWNVRVSEWDTVECGLGNAADTAQDVWVMRGVPKDARWYGAPETNTPGVKDQLRPEQYTYDDEIESVRIDFTQHTAYFRARLVTVTRRVTEEGDRDTYYFSDWSEKCGYGKDADKIEPLQPGDVAAPIITGLRMTDKEFNGNPVAAFTLAVPDALQTQLAAAAALGGSIWIEVYARVKGDGEWTSMQNADRVVKPGEMECPLLHLVNDERPTIPRDTEIELRCRYLVLQAGLDDFWSDYSAVVSFGTDDINAGRTDPADGTGEDDKSSCPICHFCPQPLGLCIFIWLLILLAVIVIVIVIVRTANKNKKKKQGR